jgi:DNA-binding NarL/FixJ family response regulator
VIRILLADDHPVVREGLRGMLSAESDIEVVGEAASGAEAVALFGALRPDVVLMDLRMPSGDGVDAIGKIRAGHASGARIIVLTTYDTDADILRAVEAGAAGYLLKDAPTCSARSGLPPAARPSSRPSWPAGWYRGYEGRGPRRCPPGRRRCLPWSRAG